MAALALAVQDKRQGHHQARRRWFVLVTFCASLNLIESLLVAGLDGGTKPYLAPQASAIAPLGVFGDLRWVSVYAGSWPAVAGELLAMVLTRGALTALSVALAWPSRLPRPPLGRLLLRGVSGTCIAAMLLWPSVALLFGLAVVPVSWLFFAAVPTALMVALVLHPAAVSGDWWRRLVAARAIGWVCLTFLESSVASAIIAALPVGAAPVIAVLSGVFNAWAWVGLVRAVTDRRPARYMVPVAAIVSIGLAGIVVGGTIVGFSIARKASASTPRVAGTSRRNSSERERRRRSSSADGQLASARPPNRAVLEVSGYGSSWDGTNSHPFAGPFIEEQFSYRGLSPQGLPLPYTGKDTAKALPELDRMLLGQIAALHARTDLTVDVVAESEGALIAKTALLAQPTPSVGALVMASPLQGPGRVSYPTTGDSGRGIASNAAMRLISHAFDKFAPVNLWLDNPFVSSLDDEAPLLQNALACPLSGAKQFALLPLADATVAPVLERFAFPSVVLPAFHGGLLETSTGRRFVSRALRQLPVDGDHLLDLADEAISDAASAWQVPSLAPSKSPLGGQSKVTPASCRLLGHELHNDLAPAN